MATDRDTTRSVVKTYVPAYQKERWQEHAEDLGMSQSEFLRSMVQAGRRGYGSNGAGEPDDTGNEDGGTDSSGNTVEVPSAGPTPGGDALEDRVLDALDDGPCSWDELVDRVIGDIEEQLDAVLEGLQESNRVRYSGRNGGYTRIGGD